MSRLEGGIFSRPRGKTGGVVFGAARTRLGKVVTSRLLVVPTNPKTQAQVAQRTNFTRALEAVRSIGPNTYRSDWNRAIAQLPGFQSMISVIMGMQAGNGDLTPGPTTNLGTLNGVPDPVLAWNAGDGRYELDWTNPQTGGGLPTDEIIIVWLSSSPDGSTGLYNAQAVRAAATRADESVIIEDADDEDSIVVGAYFIGADSTLSEGQKSPCVWLTASKA